MPPLHQVEIRYDPKIPKFLRIELSRYITAGLNLVPPWVHFIMVVWKDDEPNSILCRIFVDEDYRYCTLQILPGWVDRSDTEKAEDIRHEFHHILVDPLHRLAERVVDLIPDEAMKKWMKAELKNATERVVCDSEFVYRRISPEYTLQFD